MHRNGLGHRPSGLPLQLSRVLLRFGSKIDELVQRWGWPLATAKLNRSRKKLTSAKNSHRGKTPQEACQRKNSMISKGFLLDEVLNCRNSPTKSHDLTEKSNEFKPLRCLLKQTSAAGFV